MTPPTSAVQDIGQVLGTPSAGKKRCIAFRPGLRTAGVAAVSSLRAELLEPPSSLGVMTMSSRCACSLALVLSLAFAGLATAAENRGADKQASLGTKLDKLSLDDFRGKTHALSDYADSKVIVLAFLGVECPLCKMYGPRLEQLSKDYADRGVTILGIDSNRQDSLTEMAAYARQHGIQFPLLKDLNNTIADSLGAERTPEMIVLDRDRVVRYRGRIDDQYGFQSGTGYARPKVSRRDLVEAIDELLAGKPVSQPTSEAAGCLIGRVRPVKEQGGVTYSDQIAHLPESLRRMSSRRTDRSVHIDQLRGSRRLGGDDRGSRSRSADAPLACRPALRHVFE